MSNLMLLCSSLWHCIWIIVFFLSNHSYTTFTAHLVLICTYCTTGTYPQYQQFKKNKHVFSGIVIFYINHRAESHSSTGHVKYCWLWVQWVNYIVLVEAKTLSLLLELFYVPCFNVIKFFTFGLECIKLFVVMPVFNWLYKEEWQ